METFGHLLRSRWQSNWATLPLCPATSSILRLPVLRWLWQWLQVLHSLGLGVRRIPFLWATSPGDRPVGPLRPPGPPLSELPFQAPLGAGLGLGVLRSLVASELGAGLTQVRWTPGLLEAMGFCAGVTWRSTDPTLLLWPPV